MDRLEALPTFVAVVEHEGFASASRALDLALAAAQSMKDQASEGSLVAACCIARAIWSISAPGDVTGP